MHFRVTFGVEFFFFLIHVIARQYCIYSSIRAWKGGGRGGGGGGGGVELITLGLKTNHFTTWKVPRVTFGAEKGFSYAFGSQKVILLCMVVNH